MDSTLITQHVVTTLHEILDKKDQTIEPATRLQDLGVDNLDRFELVIRCEDLFHVEISDEAAEQFATVEDIVAFVARQQETK